MTLNVHEIEALIRSKAITTQLKLSNNALARLIGGIRLPLEIKITSENHAPLQEDVDLLMLFGVEIYQLAMKQAMAHIDDIKREG